MTNATGKVALTASFPVDVLMKSDPAIMQTRLALYTFVREPSSPEKKNYQHVKSVALAPWTDISGIILLI